MNRRRFLQAGLGLAVGTRLTAAMKQDKLDEAVALLDQSVQSGMIEAASLLVRHRGDEFTRSFGAADSQDSIFLLASITKPMAIAAVMTLRDRGEFDLEDPVTKFIPEFRGDGRETISIGQLMTHCSGLPDQLPENAQLRAAHAGLDQFVEAAIRTPLLFPPGSRYRYSSMAILLASELARRITRESFPTLMQEVVFQPLGMKHSALGVGHLEWPALMRCQVEKAAPESGAGDPSTSDWDWNSPYWRKLGSPWGGAHGSAADVARFLAAFLEPRGVIWKPETVRQMVSNQNPKGIRPRGLGFDLGSHLGGSQTSPRAFGHGGSTGTLCWADPETDTLFVVLTTLPSQATKPHPRDITSRVIAEAVN